MMFLNFETWETKKLSCNLLKEMVARFGLIRDGTWTRCVNSKSRLYIIIRAILQIYG